MPLRPPSRVEPIRFPVFGMSWFGNAGTGASVVAYTGGGGSSKTGIFNSIVVQLHGVNDGDDEPVHHPVADENNEPDHLTISTGDLVGVAVHVYQNPLTNSLWLVVALDKEIRRYSLPSGELAGVLQVVTKENVGPPAAVVDAKLPAASVPSKPSEQPPAAVSTTVTTAPVGSSGNSKQRSDTTAMAVNAVTVNNMANQVAVGCESGIIKVYGISDENCSNSATDNESLLYQLNGHSKTVCACYFSARGHRLVSSAKDGTACVWEQDRLLATLQCVVEEEAPKKPQAKNRRPTQILVRGCAFADLEGRVALTVASARRGKAVLSQWVEQAGGGPPGQGAPSPFQCVVRTDCSTVPISAMSLSGDAGLLALGSVDGSILLWDVAAWKLLKKFPEVHGLPVTCIAARPFPVPLQGEEGDGVEIHARSASADSQLACLTMQRRAPRQKKASGGAGSSTNPFAWLQQIIVLALVAWAIYPVIFEAQEKCMGAHPTQRINSRTGERLSLHRCIIDKVLLAPADRPGISVPPH